MRYVYILLLAAAFSFTAHANSVSVSYIYDDIGRLTSVSYSSGQQMSYTYDAAGNIIQVAHQNAEIEPQLRLEAGDSQITAFWNETQGHDYSLFISSDTNCDVNNYSRCPNGQMFPNVTSGYTISGLDNGREYYVILQIEGEGIDRAILTGAVAATPQPTQPSPATGRLNDTGIDWCADGSSNNLQCPVAGFPGQDGDHGRDALARQGQLQKIGAGAAGFDYTKLDANGRPLAIQNMPWSDGGNETDGTRWSCVHDNVTGLIWEVKVNDPTHLRHHGHTYTWFNPDPNTNGGDAGTQNGGTCVGSACDTLGYVQAVNTQGLCGANDWRMPDRFELASIVHRGRSNPAIDTDFFPHTPSNWFRSASPAANPSHYAWNVGFDVGYVSRDRKDSYFAVRLVRGGQ